MRLLGFTLLAIAVGTAIQFGLSHLPYSVDHALGKYALAFMFVLPMLATAGLAYVTRFPDVIYVYFLVFVSPYVTWVLGFLFSVFVLNERFYL